MHLTHPPIITMQEKNTKKILVSGSLRMKDTSSGSNNQIPSYGSMAFVSVAISLKKDGN
jgi:hypothetical protein